MTVYLELSDGRVHGIDQSLSIEGMPNITPYTYVPSYKIYPVVQLFDADAELSDEVVGAAASIIKVSAWSNARRGQRSWDTLTIPREVPQEPIDAPHPKYPGELMTLAVYNCVSLPHFVAGERQLYSHETPFDWRYDETRDVAPTGIERLVPANESPAEIDVCDGHWIVNIGDGSSVFPNDPQARDVVGANEQLVMHVNGADGPLLISSRQAAIEYWSYCFGSDAHCYTATPVL